MSLIRTFVQNPEAEYKKFESYLIEPQLLAEVLASEVKRVGNLSVKALQAAVPRRTYELLEHIVGNVSPNTSAKFTIMEFNADIGPGIHAGALSLNYSTLASILDEGFARDVAKAAAKSGVIRQVARLEPSAHRFKRSKTSSNEGPFSGDKYKMGDPTAEWEHQAFLDLSDYLDREQLVT